MPEFSAQNRVHNVPIIREENQAGGIFVQPTDRKDSLRVADFRDDVPFHMGFTGRRDTDRLVILDIDRRLTPGNHLSVPGDDVARAHVIAQLGNLTVDRDGPRLDQAIRLASGADPLFREEFVDADRLIHRRSV